MDHEAGAVKAVTSRVGEKWGIHFAEPTACSTGLRGVQCPPLNLLPILPDAVSLSSLEVGVGP